MSQGARENGSKGERESGSMPQRSRLETEGGDEIVTVIDCFIFTVMDETISPKPISRSLYCQRYLATWRKTVPLPFLSLLLYELAADK